MEVIRKNFADDLRALQEDLELMSELAGRMLELSCRALKDGDNALADEAIKLDDQVDALNLKIETKCLELIALQQPMGKDLRVIAGILKIITDVERVGDYSVDLAKFARRLNDDGAGGILVDLPRLADLVKNMLHLAMKALASRDLDLISKMIDEDNRVDNTFRVFFDELVDRIEKEPKLARRAIQHLMMGRYLERIADHITNIGERIYFMETGEIKELHT